MLTPDYLDMIPDGLDALFQELDEWIIKDYARRVAKAGEVTETAQGMAENAELLGLSESELKKETARILKLTREQLEAIFGDTAFLSAKNDADRFRSAGLSADRILKNRFLRKYIEAAYKQTYGNFKNITGTLGVAVGDNFENLTDYYRNRLDFVQLQVSSGVISHDAAVREAVKNIASKGIMYIDYESGRRLNIASAARMCTLTGVNQMARQLNEGICDELGLDLVEVTAHEGARPTHKEWQGKIFSRSGKSKKYPDLVKSTGLGTVEGLCGAYCRHNYYGYVEGSPRAWTDDDLANIDPQPFDYNGKSYSFYEASQRMRYMERQIRKTKREIVGYEAAGLESDFVAASIRLNRQKQEYKKFAKASGVRPRLERTQEFKYGRSVAQKAVHGNKKEILIASERNQYKEYLKSLRGGKIKLRAKHKKLLSNVPNVGEWKEIKTRDISIKDLSALTAYTGDEFAIFEKGKTSILMHGSGKWSIPWDLWEIIKENKYEWKAHSHPTIDDLHESTEDISALQMFDWQEKSVIIDLEGNTIEFSADVQTWFNKMLGVVDYDEQRTRKGYSWPEAD